MAKYAAWLRGINLGGRTVKMDKLRQILEEAGFSNVRTLLASGNVVLKSKSSSPAAVRTKIEQAIEAEFGFEVHVIVHTAREILALVKSDPFKNVNVTPKTRLYITFLSKPIKTKLKLPHKFLSGDYEILELAKGHLTSVVTLTPKTGTVNAMEILSQEFGTQITTRNWNTIQKVAKLLE